MEIVHAAGYCIISFYLLVNVGNFACRQMFRLTGLNPPTSTDEASDPRAGRVIGTLERLILAVGILTHSWEVLAAVIALKTVARFKELDNKKFSEYFLAGSLFSILWAVIVTSLWILYDQQIGIDLLGMLTEALDGRLPTPTP